MSLLNVLEELKILYTDLCLICVQYDNIRQWESTAETTWDEKVGPAGLINSKQKQLYVCHCSTPAIVLYHTNHQKITENLSLTFPFGLDLDDEKNLLYVADEKNMTILNFQLEFLNSWPLPPTCGFFRGVKIDQNILYLTLGGIHCIYIYQAEDGKFLKLWNNEDRDRPEDAFDCPFGLTVDNKYVYVCDKNHHRVQILVKETGKFYSQWGEGKESIQKGKFSNPRSIYYHFNENIFYIGDQFSIQLFTKEGDLCVQRLGDPEEGNKKNRFERVYGVCVVDEHLFVSDYLNKRIQIYRRMHY